MTSSSLDVIGDRGSHDALKRALGSLPPARVLDAPCGTGVLAAFLRQRGWDVHCADIDPGNFELDGVPFTQINLNRALPFDDAYFDVVVCANAVHRLWNVRGALAEFRRILKPGGLLLINVNNYAGIDRRLRFLFYGSIDNAVNRAGCRQTIDEPEAHIRLNIFYPHLANLLEAEGFTVTRRRGSALRAGHIILAPFALLVSLLSLLAGPRSRKRNHLGAANSPALLFGGRYMLIEAQRGE